MVKKIGMIMLVAASIATIWAETTPGCNSKTYLQVSERDFRDDVMNGVPYINFTASVNTNWGGTDSILYNQPFYKTWDPDGRGQRPYHAVTFHNSSTTQSVTFIMITSEDNMPCRADTRFWVGNLDRFQNVTSYQNLDDDHGSGTNGAGAKITLAPDQYITIIISMYSSSSTYPWFNTFLGPESYSWLKSGHGQASVDANGALTIVNGN